MADELKYRQHISADAGSYARAFASALDCAANPTAKAGWYAVGAVGLPTRRETQERILPTALDLLNRMLPTEPIRIPQDRGRRAHQGERVIPA